jgi:glycosyltransferase 2 family protein
MRVMPDFPVEGLERVLLALRLRPYFLRPPQRLAGARAVFGDNGAMQAIPRRHLLMVGKALVSAAAIIFIISRFDLPFFLSYWHELDASSVIVSLAVLALETTLVAGMRLKLVLRALRADYPLARLSQIALCGFFVEQVAFGFVGGDAMRLWLLHRMGVPFRTAVEAIVIDRCLGLSALLLLVLVGLPGFLELFPIFAQPTILIAGGTLVAVAASFLLFILVGRTKYRTHPLRVEIAKLFSAVQTAGVRRCFLLTFMLACITHLMNVLVFFVIGQNLGLSVTPAQWFFIVPPALLFSMIPISAGGWGLREGVLILALARLGVPPEEAIVPSLIFGLGILVVTLPGAWVWLTNRKLDPAKDEQPFAGVGDDSNSLGPMKIDGASNKTTGV